MLVKKDFVVRRLLYFFIAAAFASGLLYYISTYAILRMPTIPGVLFPLMTIFLMVFHILIAGFMVMKYLCERKRLYLLPIACGFCGSALLLYGTLSSYPDWLLCSTMSVVNFNDALIYFVFRHILLATLFISAIALYKYRNSNMHSRKNHIIIISLMFLFAALLLSCAWIYSGQHTHFNIILVDNFTRLFTPLWRHFLSGGMMIVWVITLIAILSVTKLRNIFWISGAFFCTVYIFTLMLLLSSRYGVNDTWYQARLFETIATLFLIFVLLCDIFTLYRKSNSKYLDSYQNSIRDPLTRLYNRSYFYDTLREEMKKVSPAHPVSVIVCDLDHFKRINDRYGHLQGDKVIQFAAQTLQEHVRQNDVAARIGGEEFALLLADTGEEMAVEIAERVRQAISLPADSGGQSAVPEIITISMGVFTATAALADVEECARRADEAMYQAKAQGRDRVVVWK